jgi:hypothetical protein
MSEIPDEKVLQEVINYLHERVKQYDPYHPVGDVIGRAFTYCCMMKHKIYGEGEQGSESEEE